MAFGQKAGTGRPRGRPPKDPQLRAQYDEQVRGYISDSKVRKIDSFDSPRGSVLDVPLAHQSAEDLDGVLQDLRARYEKGIDDRVAEAVREREAIQAQFDRLKELRVTQSEKTLAEVKKASDARIRRTFSHLTQIWPTPRKGGSSAPSTPSTASPSSRSTAEGASRAAV